MTPTCCVNRRSPAARSGFALLVLLWVIVSAGALTSIVTLMGRDSFQAARNRVNNERALWRAEDCLARARATIDERIQAVQASPASGVALWRALDTAVTRNTPLPANCSFRLDAAGSRVDVNGDEAPLRRVFVSIGGQAQAPALLNALIDWRDSDSVARAHGAESPWYALLARHLPRNDSIADVRELLRIRGFDQLMALEDVLGVEPGRISIANAPSEVLAAIPGFTPETVALINSWRLRGWQINDVMALESSLTPAAAESLRTNFPEIARLSVLEPEAWVITSIGVAGAPAESVRVDVRIVRTQDRAVVVRRRTWL